MTSNKKFYVQPSVEMLGSIAEKTQNSSVPISDDGRNPAQDFNPVS